MPQTLTKIPAGAANGLKYNPTLNPWEERNWTEVADSILSVPLFERLKGSTKSNSPRKMDMDYTQVF